LRRQPFAIVTFDKVVTYNELGLTMKLMPFPLSSERADSRCAYHTVGVSRRIGIERKFAGRPIVLGRGLPVTAGRHSLLVVEKYRAVGMLGTDIKSRNRITDRGFSEWFSSRETYLAPTLFVCRARLFD